MDSAGEKAARDLSIGQDAAAEDTEWNDRIGTAHQMLSNMKTALGAAAEEQRDLQALEEASLAGQEDAEWSVRIDVQTEDNVLTEGEEVNEGDSVPAPNPSHNASDAPAVQAPAELAPTVEHGDPVVTLERSTGEHIREEIGPVTARKPVGREQPQQQDPAHGQEEQDQPQYRDVHSLAFDLLWWDGQSAAVKNGILKIQAIFRGNRCRALNKIAAQVTAHDHAVCGALCQEGCG